MRRVSAPTKSSTVSRRNVSCRTAQWIKDWVRIMRRTSSLFRRNGPNKRDTEISRIEASACGRPVRSKKHTLFIPLIVEATAWVCPWVRLYSRWSTQGRWALDDQIMFLTGVSRRTDTLDAQTCADPLFFSYSIQSFWF